MKDLDFNSYWNHIGTDNMMRVLKKANVKERYARQIKSGFKVPGRDTAIRLIDAARIVTPGWEPGLEALLRGVDADERRTRKIEPSKEFMKKSGRKAK